MSGLAQQRFQLQKERILLWQSAERLRKKQFIFQVFFVFPRNIFTKTDHFCRKKTPLELKNGGSVVAVEELHHRPEGDRGEGRQHSLRRIFLAKRCSDKLQNLWV